MRYKNSNKSGKIIKKYIISFLLMIISVLCISQTVFAVGKINISVDSELKQGKSFNIYLTITSDNPFGAIITNFEYNYNLLKLSSASLEEKSDSDYFRYSDSNGKIKLCFMTKEPQKNKVIKLRFKQLNNNTNEYDFFAYVAEAYTIDEKKIENIPSVSFKIGINQSSEIVESITDTDNSDSAAHEHSSESSRRVPVKSETDISHKQEKQDNSADYENNTSESEYQDSKNEYYIYTQHDPLNGSSPDYIALIGAVVAIGAGVIVCVKQYKKLKDKK